MEWEINEKTAFIPNINISPEGSVSDHLHSYVDWN